MPESVDSEENKQRAQNGIVLLTRYAHHINSLLKNNKTENYLRQLHATHNKDVTEWADQLISVFKKIEQLLAVVEEDCADLLKVLNHNPSDWGLTLGTMAWGVTSTGLHDDEEILKNLRQKAILQEEELAQIIAHDEHLKQLHTWQRIFEHSEEEVDLKIEQYFTKLLK